MEEFSGRGRTPGESNMALGRLSPSSPLSFVSGDRLEYQTIVDSTKTCQNQNIISLFLPKIRINPCKIYVDSASGEACTAYKIFTSP